MEEIVKRWQFTRSETIEILNTLNEERLHFKPDGDKWQPIYHHFGCMVRTQQIYAEAAVSGRMDFSMFGSGRFTSKDANQTKEDILTALTESNNSWIESLSANSGGVQWPDQLKNLTVHIMSLAEHERLHHGQLISYFTMGGYELPAGFKSNWAL